MPCMSAGRPPSTGDHAGSRCSCKRAAACAHCTLRWAVGATMTTGALRSARASRRAAKANVVLPAPGVATARKSGAEDALRRARAACCQGRSRTLRDMDLYGRSSETRWEPRVSHGYGKRVAFASGCRATHEADTLRDVHDLRARADRLE